MLLLLLAAFGSARGCCGGGGGQLLLELDGKEGGELYVGGRGRRRHGRVGAVRRVRFSSVVVAARVLDSATLMMMMMMVADVTLRLRLRCLRLLLLVLLDQVGEVATRVTQAEQRVAQRVADLHVLGAKLLLLLTALLVVVAVAAVRLLLALHQL